MRENLTEDDRELLMNLTPAYLQWREETLRQGREEGLQEGLQTGLQQGRLEERRLLVENLLRIRFTSIDETLAKVISPLLQLPAEELTRLLFELSREELLARFRNTEN